MFGKYLVAKQLVSTAHVVEALDRQIRERTPIGRLAVEAGFINMKQLFDILNTQNLEDEAFGSVAVDLGYLTQPQVLELLQQQRKRQTPIGELLIKLGAIDRETMERELAMYHALKHPLPSAAIAQHDSASSSHHAATQRTSEEAPLPTASGG